MSRLGSSQFSLGIIGSDLQTQFINIPTQHTAAFRLVSSWCRYGLTWPAQDSGSTPLNVHLSLISTVIDDIYHEMYEVNISQSNSKILSDQSCFLIDFQSVSIASSLQYSALVVSFGWPTMRRRATMTQTYYPSAMGQLFMGYSPLLPNASLIVDPGPSFQLKRIATPPIFSFCPATIRVSAGAYQPGVAASWASIFLMIVIFFLTCSAC